MQYICVLEEPQCPTCKEIMDISERPQQCKCGKRWYLGVPIEYIKVNDYQLNCLAMSIVNMVNETNRVNVEVRQHTNDDCFDYAVKQIKEFLQVNKINTK